MTDDTAAMSNLLVPTTSEILWGVDLRRYPEHGLAEDHQQHGLPAEHWSPADGRITGHPMSTIFNYIGGGATYICYVNGAVRPAFTTAVKYPVLAGGVAVRQRDDRHRKGHDPADAHEDRQGGRSIGDEQRQRYEMADDVQVYLWYKGQYYATKLAEVNSEGYYLTGWYDNFGCAAGKRVRVIVAVKKD